MTSGFNLDDELPWCLSGFQIADGLGDFAQLEDPIDDGRGLAGLGSRVSAIQLIWQRSERTSLGEGDPAARLLSFCRARFRGQWGLLV